MRRYQRDELLTASEIARYVYCQRAWSYDQRLIRPQVRRRFMLLSAAGLLLLAFLVFLALIIG